MCTVVNPQTSQEIPKDATTPQISPKTWPCPLKEKIIPHLFGTLPKPVIKEFDEMVGIIDVLNAEDEPFEIQQISVMNKNPSKFLCLMEMKIEGDGHKTDLINGGLPTVLCSVLSLFLPLFFGVIVSRVRSVRPATRKSVQKAK